ncbi:MAG: patatin-like phospholipase family protein [Steroidobacteraceae bacterium]
MLVLSGGGAGGAFGAGALVGWTRRGTRPRFEIVTGVSAGALLAPLAFLGPAWDGRLVEAFSRADTRRLLQSRWMGVFFGASMYRGASLARLVDKLVTPELLRAVARGAAEGRLLIVATTDLDREQTVFWNMGLIAAQGGPKALHLFREVIIASASVPGVFPPVMIPVVKHGQPFEEMHVDGAAIAPLFFVPDVAAILPGEIKIFRGGHLYLLVNGQFRTRESTTREQTVSILKRSVAATLQGGLRAAVEIAYSFAERDQMRTQITEIPNAYPFGGALDFDPARMNALFEFGERCARTGRLWTDPIDALDQASAREASPRGSSAECPGTTDTRLPPLPSPQKR